MSDPLNNLKIELESVITIFEKARENNIHQWATNEDILCCLYLIQAVKKETDALLGSLKPMTTVRPPSSPEQ